MDVTRRYEECPEKKPGFRMGLPSWWHHNGIKMKLNNQKTGNDGIAIENNVAFVKVLFIGGDRYQITWSINHGIDYRCGGQDRGTRTVSRGDLEAMFGFCNGVGPGSKWLFENFGATAAKQGMFIRYKEYLSMPGPGTNHDGDPNIAIEIDDEIQEAIKKLLAISR